MSGHNRQSPPSGLMTFPTRLVELDTRVPLADGRNSQLCQDERQPITSRSGVQTILLPS